MNRLFNFGSSHSIGWNCSTSYSKILANRHKLEWVDYGHAGASIEHMLMLLQLRASDIRDTDVVLVQLTPTTHTSMCVDPRKTIPNHENYRYYFYNYRSMTALDREPEDDFIYALKAYKTLVNTEQDQWIHFLIHLTAVVDKLHNIPGKKFVFFDDTLALPDNINSYAHNLFTKLTNKMIKLIDSKTLKQFASTINADNIYAVNQDGTLDSSHYNETVHMSWADYIDKSIRLGQ